MQAAFSKAGRRPYVQIHTRSSTKGGRDAGCVCGSANWAREAGTLVVDETMLPTERYIATNRFSVKSGAQARFEKRWASRKSRLGELDGFRYFMLMRRVPSDVEREVPNDEPNYVSFTVWETKRNFQAWRTGDAFKEAHGGGSIFGFADMLINATLTLNGPPKPAFWHGLLPISTPGDMKGKRIEGGWRVVDADGKSTLPFEAFVATNRFRVVEGREEDFEQRWAKRESKLRGMDGFKAFMMARRDGSAEDGFNYQSLTIWETRAAFEAWTKSPEFAKAHSAVKQGKPDPGMFRGPPSPALFEGILVLESAEGV